MNFKHLLATLTLATIPVWGLPQSHRSAAPKKVTILHTNDIHAHLDEFNSGGIDCRQTDRDRNNCVGGIARMKTVVDAYRKNTSDVLLFDAGDIFQGTLFFNVYGGWPGAQLMNELKYDAMTIGNHEFDRGVEHLAAFFKNLTFPVISSNIDFDTVPQLREVGVKPYIILEKYKLGVIGFITPTTSYISDTAKNITFKDPVNVVQSYVDELHAKGIKRIICVSHNGYFSDLEVASKTHGIHLIVGGHSHSLLLKDSTTPNVIGPYPTPIKNLHNGTTWIVQAHRYGDYLGHLDLEWDNDDKLISLEGDPIRLDNAVQQDSAIQAQVNNWRTGFSSLVTTILTRSTAAYSNALCKTGFDCPMGNLIADCMMEVEGAPYGGDFALINGGGIRASFPEGNVSVGDIMTVLPFDNAVSIVTYTGTEILYLLEHAIAGNETFHSEKPVISLPQFSNELRWTYRLSAPVGNRIQEVKIRGEPLIPSKSYKMVTIDFLANGGDAILPVKSFIAGGQSVSDVVIQCLKRHPTISPLSDLRAVRVD